MNLEKIVPASAMDESKIARAFQGDEGRVLVRLVAEVAAMRQVMAAKTAPPTEEQVQQLLITFLNDGINLNTRRSYTCALGSLQKFLKQPTILDAITWLLAQTQGEINRIVAGWQGELRRSLASSATINARTAALTSLMRAARRFGLTSLAIEIKRLPLEPAKDPVCLDEKKILEVLDNLRAKYGLGGPRAQKIAINYRHRALIALGFMSGLRIKEILGLDFPGDIDLNNNRLRILGKGRRHGEHVTMSAPLKQILQEWLGYRGVNPGPFLCVLRPNHKSVGRRLERHTAFTFIQNLFGCGPHRLRHAGVTFALRSGCPIHEVQQWARHKSISTTTLYDDRKREHAEKVANVLAKKLPYRYRLLDDATFDRRQKISERVKANWQQRITTK